MDSDVANASIVAGPSACDEALAALYERIGSRGRTALAEQRIEADPLPREGGSRWGLSAVFRRRAWSDALQACAGELRALLGGGHVVYAPDAFHVTLRQFEDYRGRIDLADRRLGGYVDALRSIAADRGPVAIRLRGLVATPGGVIVAGWPAVDLQPLRGALHDRLALGDDLLAGPEARRTEIRTSAHATLAIFGPRIAQPAALASFLDRHRTTDFGDHVFDRVFLVGYRRTRDDVTLIDYERIDFAGGRP